MRIILCRYRIVPKFCSYESPCTAFKTRCVYLTTCHFLASSQNSKLCISTYLWLTTGVVRHMHRAEGASHTKCGSRVVHRPSPNCELENMYRTESAAFVLLCKYVSQNVYHQPCALNTKCNTNNLHCTRCAPLVFCIVHPQIMSCNICILQNIMLACSSASLSDKKCTSDHVHRTQSLPPGICIAHKVCHQPCASHNFVVVYPWMRLSHLTQIGNVLSRHGIWQCSHIELMTHGMKLFQLIQTWMFLSWAFLTQWRSANMHSVTKLLLQTDSISQTMFCWFRIDHVIMAHFRGTYMIDMSASSRTPPLEHDC